MTAIILTTPSAKVTISPELGGAILAYEAKVHDEFIPILKNSSNASSVLESCSFPLVPFSNRIRNGRFQWQGKEVTLPLNHLPEKHSIHGHGWQQPWKIVEQSNTRLTLQYQHKADEWPFTYTAQQIFVLKDSSLSIELLIMNTSTRDMPAGLGIHPYFSLTDNTRLACNVEQMWAVDNETMPTKLVTPPKEFNSSDGLLVKGSNLDNAFTGFLGKATVYWPEWQAKANITTSSNCQFMVLYSPNNENFFCFEPVSHCTDAINLANNGVKNTGAKTLAPNETMTVAMKITPEKS